MIIGTDEFWNEVKRAINKVSDEYDIKWRKRKRVIGSHFLILFIFKLVLSKTKSGYGSVISEVWDEYEEKGIIPPQKNVVSTSTLCEARQKLSENVFLELNRELIQAFEKTGENIYWQGHRVFGVDGCRLTLPKDLVRSGYKFHKMKKRAIIQ